MSSGKFNNPDWHKSHISVWLRVVKPLLPKGPIQWLEIGSLEGRSALWTAENLLKDGDSLICVDRWGNKEAEANFDANTAGNSLIEKVKDRSSSFLARDIREYDAIYIDGSHDAPDVITDAVLGWMRLKVGGLMIFDDYRWNQPSHLPGLLSPMIAIDSFISCYETRISVLHKNTQVILRKRTK